MRDMNDLVSRAFRVQNSTSEPVKACAAQERFYPRLHSSTRATRSAKSTRMTMTYSQSDYVAPLLDAADITKLGGDCEDEEPVVVDIMKLARARSTRRRNKPVLTKFDMNYTDVPFESDLATFGLQQALIRCVSTLGSSEPSARREPFGRADIVDTHDASPQPRATRFRPKWTRVGVAGCFPCPRPSAAASAW
jgi:hypothetical protein